MPKNKISQKLHDLIAELKKHHKVLNQFDQHKSQYKAQQSHKTPLNYHIARQLYNILSNGKLDETSRINAIQDNIKQYEQVKKEINNSIANHDMASLKVHLNQLQQCFITETHAVEKVKYTIMCLKLKQTKKTKIGIEKAVNYIKKTQYLQLILN